MLKLRWAIFLWVACALAWAGEEPTMMAPFRVKPSDLLFDIRYLERSDAITEVRVKHVVPGSTAEKAGIQKGDLLVAIRGQQLEGKRRSAIIGPDGRFKASGALTFERKGGLFRKPWSLTVEAEALRGQKTEKKVEDRAL
ncbi:MAG: PDZ domain-containing protein [Verrucomicrobiota bacterium]